VTSKKVGSGTDANVYCQLIGTKGKTGKILLGDDASNSRFEQGSTDSFNLDVEGDVGEIVELVLGHDNKGGGSDWNVQEARLADTITQNVYSFTCDAWLGGAFGKPLERNFKPDKSQ